MSVINDLKKHMSKNEKDEIINILRENNMMNVVGDEFLKLDDIGFNINRVWANYNWRRVNEIFRVFEEKGIEYILFKGIVISQTLYGDPYKRDMGDIDFFVFENDYNNAIEVLEDFGFNVMESGDEKNPHHTTYTDRKLIIELHKRIFNPRLGVDETYLRHHTIRHSISNNKIITFDITATILHLIYHLYMDTWLAHTEICYFLKNRKFPQTKRFLYRAYEIALFSEKYNDVISWEDILKDIEKQQLRACFKKMIEDILDIFPNSFPIEFTQMIRHLNYIGKKCDQSHKCLIISACGEKLEYRGDVLRLYRTKNAKIE